VLKVHDVVTGGICSDDLKGSSSRFKLITNRVLYKDPQLEQRYKRFLPLFYELETCYTTPGLKIVINRLLIALAIRFNVNCKG